MPSRFQVIRLVRLPHLSLARLRSPRTLVSVGVALILSLSLAAGMLVGSAHADAPIVLTTCDFTTLSAAISNAPSGADIQFGCDGTIDFTRDITVTRDITLDASGHSVTLDGQNQAFVFFFWDQGIQLTLDHLSMVRGMFSNALGGAIHNAGGTVTISDSTFQGDSTGYAGGSGGAIFTQGGAINVTNTAFVSNYSGKDGGAIYNDGGTVSIDHSLFLNNTATGDGDYGTGASLGGAIATLGGTTNIENSTFVGNSALGLYGSGPGFGGAIETYYGSVTIRYSTFAGNHAKNGAIDTAGGTTTLVGSLLAANDGGDCSQSTLNTLIDGGYNLADDGSCPFASANHSLSNTPAGFDPAGLADNGGPTQTVALSAGSAAIGAGGAPQSAGGPCPATDQRGYGRPDDNDSVCDIGAYEFGAHGAQRATSIALSSSAQSSVVGQPVSFTATVSPSPDGGTVAFYQDAGSGPQVIASCDAVNVDTNSSDAAYGTASCPVTYITAGAYNITANYSGDSGYMASSTASALTQTVNQAATSTVISSGSNPSAVGQSVTYTASVGVVAPGAGTPTGSVTFADSSGALPSSCANAPVSSGGAATCTVSYSTTGSHTMSASYSGDTNFKASAAAALTQNVDTSLSGYPQTNGVYNLGNSNLAGAYLAGANLSGANVSNTNLAGAALNGANLTNANLNNTNLKSANLTNANLSGASLAQVNLKGANLTGANLSGATGMSSANVSGVTWSNTTCPDGSNSSAHNNTCAGHL